MPLADPRSDVFHDPFAEDDTGSKAGTKVSDPLERMNRLFFRVNDRFYFWILRPTAKS